MNTNAIAFAAITDCTKTSLRSVMMEHNLVLRDNTTIVVERPFTRPLKRWGHTITITISNGAVRAETDYEGEVDAADIDRVIFYFVGEYGREDIMSITVK